MTKGTKIGLSIGLGALALAGIGTGLYLAFRKSEDKDVSTLSNDNDNNIVLDEFSINGETPIGTYPIINIGTPADAINSGLTSIGLSNRTVKGSLDKGYVARITGGKYAGDYDIESFWNDANGNIGAIYIPSAQLQLDRSLLTGTGARRYDKSMNNKGINVEVFE